MQENVKSQIKEPPRDLVDLANRPCKKCIDTIHGFLCKFGTSKGRHCHRKTYAGRDPILIKTASGNGQICELFIVGNKKRDD